MILVEKTNENEFSDSEKTIASLGLDEFEEKVLKDSNPVLVLFMRHDPEFKEQIGSIKDICTNYAGRLKVYLLGDEALRTFRESFAVKGTPTFLLFMNGIEKGRLLGQVDSTDLNDFLSRMLQL
ncbi:MAG: thioredoxin family protein [Syntrophales bacterium]|jgi:thioredoxin 1|nr:thioredoxin family protein [Syntrophales bacterium]